MHQFKALQDRTPRQYFVNVNSENSEYCNQVEAAKNCYLISGSIYSRDCLYGVRILHCNDCVDCLWADTCELCYECVDCKKCYDVQYAQNCLDVRNANHVVRCQSSSDLLFCVNLRQQKHCILNEQLTPEAYTQRRGEILQSDAVYKEYVAAFERLLLSQPVPHVISRLSEHCSGNYMQESSNVHNGFDILKAHDAAYLFDVMDIKDSMDVYSFYGPGELCYEVYSAGVGAFHSLFVRDCWPCTEIYYCDYCFSCEHCFGCIGLRHKKYCILNKQYTQEEYERLVPQIIEKMKADKEWGEYFPIQDSPFPYNESIAQDFFPISQQEVEKRGWIWLRNIEENPKARHLLTSAEIPKDIENVSDSILDQAVECEVTGRPFKIIKQELDYYRRMNLPLPHLHPNERHRRRMLLRNPRKLWDRECMKCEKGIMTTYAPDRPEIVYCEECYLATVY